MNIHILLSFLLISSCHSQNTRSGEKKEVQDMTDEICISFDQRQCQTDAFAKYLPSDKNSNNMFQGMHSYLTELGFKVLHMRIDMNFHEFTCAACDICPESHRFFLSVSKTDIEKFENLKLLNFNKVNCKEHF